MEKILPLLAITAAAAHAQTFTFHHENVIGTSLELRIAADDEAAAKRAEARVLAEIDRLSAVLSTRTKDSEISRWEAAGKAVDLSPDLAAVLKACDDWAAHSGGAFNARVKARATADMAKPAWKFISSTQAAYMARPGEISVDALAKGYIIDRAAAQAAGPGVASVTLNIGGDLIASGVQSVAIADPLHDAENASPLETVVLNGQAMATSGNYRRGNHIIDPRNGSATGPSALSVSVIARDAITADALATICHVLQPAESIPLIDAMPGASCLIIDGGGTAYRSSHWPAGTMPVAAPAAIKAMEMNIEFELIAPEVGRYHRPYLAMWLENTDGLPVRTLNLWMQNKEKGLRYLPELKRWCRADKSRRINDNTDIVPTISSATRNPGKYSVSWDGLDDHQIPVPAGEYTLYIEVAREHGTYQLMKHTFKVGEAFKKDLEGNVEIKGASLDYHLKAVAQ